MREKLDGPGCTQWLQIWEAGADFKVFMQRIARQDINMISCRTAAKMGLLSFHSSRILFKELEQDATQDIQSNTEDITY